MTSVRLSFSQLEVIHSRALNLQVLRLKFVKLIRGNWQQLGQRRASTIIPANNMQTLNVHCDELEAAATDNLLDLMAVAWINFVGIKYPNVRHLDDTLLIDLAIHALSICRFWKG